MKQRIDIKQLNELTHEQKLRLLSLRLPQNGDFYVWYRSKGGIGKETYIMDNSFITEDPEAKLFAVPLLSIGQMIELLDDERQSAVPVPIRQIVPNIDVIYTDSLCDSLWEVCKSVL